MTPYTQSNVSPGNCWQTAVACLLDTDPVALPDQVAIEAAGRSYRNGLNTYLRKHHGLLYHEIDGFVMGALSVRDPGWHMLTGETVRTTAERRIYHVVVARHGEQAWDPHPSRAGLSRVLRWAFLLPFPNVYVESWDRMKMDPCACASCLAGDA